MKSMRELRKENPNFRVLYHTNYWDGPLSGVCLWDGKKQYFDVIYDEKYSYMDEWSEWEKFCKENGIEIDSYEDVDDGIIYYTDRIYAVYDTPDDVMKVMENRNELFCKYVGTHCNYDEDGNRGRGARIPLRPDHPEDLGDLRPYSEHDKFYKADIEKPDIRKDEWKILGKFVYPF